MAKSKFATGVWEHFTVQDGLPDMKIECVFEDGQGRLWIGTHDQGVVCHEAGEFHRYSFRDGLSGEGVFSIVEDGQGNLWLATNRGLTVYDGRNFTRLDMDSPGSFLWGSCRDLQGRLWFGMERQPGRPPMVARWDGHAIEYLPLSGQALEEGPSVHQIVCDAEGTVWLGGEGLYRYADGLGFQDVGRVKGHVGIVTCMLVRGAEVWGAANNGVWICRHGKFEEIAFRDHPYSLCQSLDGRLWLLTYGGALYTENDGGFELVYKLQGAVRGDLEWDQVGRLWVGTYGMGVYRCDFGRTRVFQEDQGFPPEGVTCLAEDRNKGILWVGTRRGAMGWDGVRTLQRDDVLLRGDAEVGQLLQDSKGNLWVATRNGQLLCCSDSSSELLPTPAMVKRYRIGSLVEDHDGQVWFGLRLGKGFGYCRGKQIEYYPPNPEAQYPVWIGAIEVDRKGRVWLGSAAPAQWEGLCCYDGKTFEQVKGFGLSAVLALREDREGVLWIGTSAGVKWYDGCQFGELTREQGLPCEIVTAIHPDLEGTFWFGTEGGGVCRYDGKVCQVIQIPGDQRCNVIHAIHQDRRGVIWLATEGGLVEYTPNRVKPEVAIPELIADQCYPEPGDVQLAGAPTLTRIRFQGRSPVYPAAALVYRYHLEGHDPVWHQTREQWVEYTRLKPGSYTFRVEAVDPDLNYSAAGQVRIDLTADPRIGAINEAAWNSVGQGGFIGNSKALQRVVAQVETVARSNVNVLVLGETGTGKGLVARAVHEQSERSEGPFIFVNCGTLRGDLVDSELFGHERGAFTGAAHRKIGKFELAAGGSIFLDEIGDLPRQTQVHLLHVIQDRFIERVGGDGPIPIDVRIIAATNRDLKRAVDRGRFRADLFFRLNDFAIVVPPLRERLEDLPLLAAYFLRQLAGHLGRPVPRLSEEAMAALAAYSWPGNIRELEHILRRTVIELEEGEIRAAHLGIEVAARPQEPRAHQAILPLEEYERRYLNQVLELTGGRIYGDEGAAALLGLHPNTLRSRMQKLGVKKPSKDSSRRQHDIP
ncbi:MAG: sigma 54-interacting transcriptional regulator [Candidatus Latescibacteria bacterium]|nr:sigma 54-interacting transcriptional regulator [Candidatus Latescibacterota bacterium]